MTILLTIAIASSSMIQTRNNENDDYENQNHHDRGLVGNTVVATGSFIGDVGGALTGRPREHQNSEESKSSKKRKKRNNQSKTNNKKTKTKRDTDS